MSKSDGQEEIPPDVEGHRRRKVPNDDLLEVQPLKKRKKNKKKRRKIQSTEHSPIKYFSETRMYHFYQEKVVDKTNVNRSQKLDGLLDMRPIIGLSIL